MIRILLSIFLFGIVTINAANPRVAGGQSVVLETNGTHYVTALDGTSTVAEQTRATIGKSIYDFGATANGDITLVLSNVPSATPVIIPKYGSPFYVSSSTNVDKHLILLFEKGAEIQHVTNATGHMIHMDGGSITLIGMDGNGVLDGNKANQTSDSTNYFALVYAKEPYIENMEFRDWMHAAVYDVQTEWKGIIRNSEIYEGYTLATNATKANAAVSFAPGVASTRPLFITEGIIMTNSAPSAGKRKPGGIYSSGNANVDSFNHWYASRIWMNYVGDDHTVGASHYGIAGIDGYQFNEVVSLSQIVITNSSYSIKLQNGASTTVDTAVIGTDGNWGIGLTQGERLNDIPYQPSVLRNIVVYGSPSRTYGAVINVGDTGASLGHVEVDGLYAFNCFRMLEIEAFVDATGVAMGDGPFILNNLQGEAGSGVVARGVLGTIALYNSGYRTTNGSWFLMTQTNSTAVVRLRDNDSVSDLGGNVTVRGVAKLYGSGNTLNAISGTALNLEDDADGNDIGYLAWDKDNRIIAGSISITAADITSGYYGSEDDTTLYPGGLIYGPDTGIIYRFRYDTNEAANVLRIQNLTSGGGAMLTIAAEDTLGTLGAYDNTFSDSERADRLELRAESSASGLDFYTVAGTIRAKAAGVLSGTWTTTNYAQVGNITVADEALTSSWNGSLQVPTKNAIWDYLGAITNVAGFALGDLSTTLTTGNGKAYWVAPYDGTVLGVFGSLLTASASGGVQYDINKNGTTILSTQLTVDATEVSSITAATNAVISVPNFSAGDVFTMDVDVAGSSAAGPQINIAWKRR
jgi:hypothetical protein